MSDRLPGGSKKRSGVREERFSSCPMKILLCVCERERENRIGELRVSEIGRKFRGGQASGSTTTARRGRERKVFSLTEGEVVGGVNFLFWKQ